MCKHRICVWFKSLHWEIGLCYLLNAVIKGLYVGSIGEGEMASSCSKGRFRLGIRKNFLVRKLFLYLRGQWESHYPLS